MKIIARRDVLLLVLVVHLGVDVLLILRASRAPTTWWVPTLIDYALAVLPLAQGCLIALWAATARVPFSLRLPLALVATVIPFVVSLWQFESTLSGPGAYFAFTLLAQLLIILILINVGRLVRRQLRFWRSARAEVDNLPTQFSLRQLLLWTAILAFILGTGKALFGWLGWTTELFNHENLCFFGSFALYNALYALLAFAVFTGQVRWPVRILLFALVVFAGGALACSMPLVQERLFGMRSGLDVVFSLILAAPQLVYHTITLWPLWLCGYIGRRGQADTGPHETTPASDNPFAQ